MVMQLWFRGRVGRWKGRMTPENDHAVGRGSGMLILLLTRTGGKATRHVLFRVALEEINIAEISPLYYSDGGLDR